jgi:uncharacterized protein
MEPLVGYQLLGRHFEVMPVKALFAPLLVIFALFEVLPKLETVSFDRKYLPLGGALSGFFGGLSGNQGALRSAFLARCGLSKESFIATGVVIACIVDIMRIAVYGSHIATAGKIENMPLLFAATVSAFLGDLIANRLMKKATMRTIQIVVSGLLFGIALALGFGII